MMRDHKKQKEKRTSFSSFNKNAKIVLCMSLFQIIIILTLFKIYPSLYPLALNKLLIKKAFSYSTKLRSMASMIDGKFQYTNQ